MTAFAMVSDTPQEQLQEWIGHDGSEIIFEHLGDRGRRCFTAQECMMALFKHKGLGFLTIELDLVCVITEDNFFTVQCELDTLKDFLANNDAVLSGQIHGKQHSLAWCHESKMLFDPCGLRYPLDKLTVSHAHILTSK